MFLNTYKYLIEEWTSCFQLLIYDIRISEDSIPSLMQVKTWRNIKTNNLSYTIQEMSPPGNLLTQKPEKDKLAQES